MNGNSRVAECQFLNRRRFQVAGNNIPKAHVKSATGNTKDCVPVYILPFQIFKSDMPGEIRQQLFYGNRAAQHILLRNRVIKYLRRAAAENLQHEDG